MRPTNYIQISLEEVNVAIRGKKLLHDINLQIARGEIISLIGPSGSGKTTLLKLILELLFPGRGWKITGKIECFPGLRVAYINQNPALQVFKNFVYEEFSTRSKTEVAALLIKHECLSLLEKRCLELSQGEKTIIAILRALSLNVDVLVLDEVMVNLSQNKCKWLQKTILNFKMTGGTVILADHSEKITDFSDRFLLFHSGIMTPIDVIVAKKFLSKESKTILIPKQSQNFTTKNVLSIHNARDQLIGYTANKPLSFIVNSGEILGISGDNGSGKSTLLEIICGIKKIEQGYVSWNEQILKGMRSRKKIMTFCTATNTQQFLTEKVQTELELSVPDLRVATVQNIIELFQLNDLLKYEIESLSFGQKQRLAIVLTILSDAQILLFDEPTYGMDSFALQAFVKSLQFLVVNGKIPIIASHDVALLNAVANKIIYL